MCHIHILNLVGLLPVTSTCYGTPYPVDSFVGLTERSKKYTAFSTEFGVFDYNVVRTRVLIVTTSSQVPGYLGSYSGYKILDIPGTVQRCRA
eukprot:SAG11_NODE_15839_length_566_cov_0.603004_1_plen_92_part_00